MKNSFLSLFLLAITFIQAQEGIKAGIHGSLPIGDNQEVTSLAAGIDLGYMFALGEVADLGIMAGFINGFPEKYDQEPGAPDLPHVQFVPLAASVRIWPTNSISIGGDIGQAFGLNDGNDGGLYYKPTLGYLLGPLIELNVSYTGIQVDGASWATVNLGILHTFPTRPRRL